MKKTVALIFTVILLTGAFSLSSVITASADDGEVLTSGDFQYTVANNEVEIVKYINNEDTVSIPSTIDGYPVTSIGGYAFFCDLLSSVKIPSSVTNIGNGAFSDCYNLEYIDIPNTITSIGSFAFNGTKYDTENRAADGILYLENYLVSADCYTTTYTNYTVKSGTKVIAGYTFGSIESLEKITIPDSVVYIGNEAFTGCLNLSDVTIGEGVQTIGDRAFAYCTSLDSITLPDSVVNLGEEAFRGCESLSCIDFSANLKSIEWCTFQSTALTAVILPDSVEYIGKYAFSYMESLSSVTFGKGTSKIDEAAFTNCSKLSYVSFSEALEYIGENAFYSCSNLKKVNIADIAAWCDVDFKYAFDNPVYYAKNILINGEEVSDLVIPETVTEIKKFAFLNCKNIESIYIGLNVNSVVDSTFSGCTAVLKVHKNSNVYDVISEQNVNLELLCTDTDGKWNTAEEHHFRICECGAEFDTAKHTGGQATCKTKAKCTVCNKYYGSLAEHTSVTKDIAATCSNTGTKGRKKCSVCGTVTYKGATVAQKAHNYSTKVVKKATLSADGSTQKYCTVCGKVASTSAIKRIKSVKLSAKSLTYNGKVQQPTVAVKDSAGNTVNSKYYKVSYEADSKNVGKYAVTVNFKGNYSGTKKLTFKINPPKTEVSKLVSGKKALKVSVSEKTEQVSGYQVQYSANKKFIAAKAKNLRKNSKTSIKLKGLKSNKTYYVRVRTYKKIGKIKYYSGWSVYKSEKTK